MPPDRPKYPEYLIVPSLDELVEVRPAETETHFTVPDAVNPFREYFIAGGIAPTAPETQECKDREINLEQILQSDIASYRASHLEHWADALELIRGDIRMTPEKRAIIEQEVLDGAIIIFMPGRACQLETTTDQYKALKPVWIKDRAVQTFNVTYLWGHTDKLIADKNPALIQDIPERPYLILRKPAPRVEARTTNKTVDQQKAEVIKINQERARAGLPPIYPANPAGWAAFEKRATESIQQSAPQPLTTLTPPDDFNDSYHRFIQLPLSSDGVVPVAYFSPGSRALRFGSDVGPGAVPGGGVRLEVRVEV